jgi:hypothetical protein
VPDSSRTTYLAQRASTLSENSALSFSASTPLSAAESTLSDSLAVLLSSYTVSERSAHSFPPTKFFHDWSLDTIAATPLYSLVSSMPKGGALHLHSGSSGSTDWIVNEGILLDGVHVYMRDSPLEDTCITANTAIPAPCDAPGAQALLPGTIAFFPNSTAVTPGFKPGAEADPVELRSLLTSNAGLKEADSELAWGYFNDVFTRINPIMCFRPFYRV